MNLAKPAKIREGHTRAVWADDEWLQKHAGETLNKKSDDTENEKSEGDTEEVIKSK